VTPDLVTPELRAWLTRDHEVAPDGWADDPPAAELRCDPALVERLATLARPLRPRRTFVDGCPVVHHRDGPPFAAAWGTGSLVLRATGLPAVLAPSPALDGWVRVDPWPGDVAFTRGTDALRRAVVLAYASAAPHGRSP
jgi:hypothetical protein